jgi:hypothetical protein
MIRVENTFLRAILLLTTMSCGQLWGDHDLGDNFSLLEGDKVQDRVIVYCSGRSFDACRGGTAIVPVYSRQFDKDGDYAEFVETAEADDKFIIVRTLKVKDKGINYWIIDKDFKIQDCDKLNCDSIIQSKVIGPLDKFEFQAQTEDLNINLEFN